LKNYTRTSSAIRGSYRITESAIARGERIASGFVELAVNQVVSRRFVKKQQMERRDKTGVE